MCHRGVMYERHVHLLLDNERYRRVAAEAKRRGWSFASVVRDAIDQALPDGEGDSREDDEAVELRSGR